MDRVHFVAAFGMLLLWYVPLRCCRKYWAACAVKDGDTCLDYLFITSYKPFWLMLWYGDGVLVLDCMYAQILAVLSAGPLDFIGCSCGVKTRGKYRGNSAQSPLGVDVWAGFLRSAGNQVS